MNNKHVVVLHPSNLQGAVQAPTSKSYMQRALALALLHPGETKITNPGKSADDIAALSIIENLGAKIRWTANALYVKGVSTLDAQSFHAGESGLSLRMFTPIAALASAEITITGEGSLTQRPMNDFAEIFDQLQVKFTSAEGKLPLTVNGPMLAKNIIMDGSLSSQFLTGFLIALSFAAKEQIVIRVNELKSKPYISLTLSLLEKFGYKFVNNNFEEFIIKPTDRDTEQISCIVEGDWSGASFLLVAGAINGNVTVNGLSLDSAQADKKIMEALMDAGANVIKDDESITVSKSDLVAFDFDATDCPDLFPPLVALASCCKGTSNIKGVSRLKHKESDRATALMKEFAILGVEVEVKDDIMSIVGAKNISGGKVHSHHDHRIAMATAIMISRAESAIEIEEPMAINKSYPQFYEDLKRLGVSIIN